ncbi:MAG: nuclear transport factor 2 family protein [Polaribacter sp.]|uniref:nuclear transport factor 2 family protein n=1 Tax=Polaribacter sp. TaxID=1920175 RepID=UPI002F361204
MKKIIVLIAIIFIQNTFAQTEIENINETLLNYIEGTANGEPDRVREAFHENLNLYHVKKDTLVTWVGKKYVNNIKKGGKSNRIGRVVSVDYENDAAIAKIEIIMPIYKRVYTDYLMLLKIKGKWKIIHKSFTFITYRK